MKKLFPKPRAKRKEREAKPLLTNRDPAYRGQKLLKAINNEEGWYR
ncbi:hypothetical protein ES703_17904 [subsurface metagenome]